MGEMKDTTARRAQDYEEIIGSIKDVLSARVRCDEAGAVTEVHILARANKSPSQVVRDVESALIARFGATIDPKQISVAQIREQTESALLPVRVALEGVTVGLTGSRIEARVQLSLDGKPCEGVVAGPRAGTNRLRLVAAATLAAVEQTFVDEGLFTVEDVALVTLGKRRTALVSVISVEPEGEKPFLGSCYLKHDEREAVARATLDAINRKLSLLVKK